MKKVVPFLVILTFLGCKEDVVKRPKHLIEKSKMVNIMYDLAILEAIKYQNPAVLDSNQIHPKQFIYKKYGVDSLQLAQNNVYYASDYKNYKIMYEEVVKRIEKDKNTAKALIKIEAKKKKLKEKKTKNQLQKQ
ncbi:MAG: hypothetical protein RLZZ323_1159 [Bacteroidota bacterium]|jgi:hypothetical protein